MKNINDLRESRPEYGHSVERTNFIFFDIETSGLCVERGARILEVALINRDTTLFSWKQSPLKASDEYLKTKLPEILSILSKGVIVGHNVSFDLNFIAYKSEKLGFKGPDVYFIDTLSLSKMVIQQAGNYKLETMLRYFDISLHGQLHTALVDANATQALFWKLIEKGEIGTLKESGMNRLNWSVF